jgi:hypothetical protein
MPIRDERQTDPTPPPVIDALNPSLTLYGVLIGLAALMIVAAFVVAPPDWPGLFLNLATEILGAVILLIVVDRRIRSSDIRLLQGVTQRARMKFVYFLNPNIRPVARYVEILNARLEKIHPVPYFRRSFMDELQHHIDKGFVLRGAAGMGKSVILQDIALNLAKIVLAEPTKNRVPIFLPLRHWAHGSLIDQLFDTVSSYSPVPHRTIQKLLREGRAAIILDGLDEMPERRRVAPEIHRLRSQYPNLVIILSTRTHVECEIEGLQAIEIPPLTKQEQEEWLADVRPKR